MANINTNVPPYSTQHYSHKQEGLSSKHLLIPPRLIVHTHYLCMWPSLVARLGKAIKPPLQQLQKLPSAYAAGKYTQVCKGNKCSPTPLTHACLHENINLLIHALLVYVICSGLGVFYIDIPIGLLN